MGPKPHAQTIAQGTVHVLIVFATALRVLLGLTARNNIAPINALETDTVTRNLGNAFVWRDICPLTVLSFGVQMTAQTMDIV